MKPVIFVAGIQYEKGKEVWAGGEELDIRYADTDEQTLADLVRRYQSRAVILGVEAYRGPLYEALAGGLIARFGVGCDGIDKDLCRRHNVILTNTAGMLSQSVAEHAIFLMGALVRHIARCDRLMHGETWQPMMGSDCAGKTLVIAGVGQIGRQAARIAGAGLAMRVIGFDCLALETPARAEGLGNEDFLAKYHLAKYVTNIDDVLPEADVVSVHLTAGKPTHHFFNEQRFRRFRDAAFLVNTARGPIVDETALYRALRSGKLAGAALDVFENEPYQPVSPECDLRKLENVVLTPHVGSNTRESNRRMAENCLANCRNFLAGKLDRLSRAG